MENKITKFKGKIIKSIFDSPDFKVYAMEVSKSEYPYVKYNKYGNVSLSGEITELTFGVEYEIEAIEQETKYGTGYKAINIRRDVPKTSEEMYLFLQEILTENQARVLFENYPDIVQRVKENKVDDIDFDKLKGIKEKTFKVIQRKIIENFCLADLVIEFKGYINLSILKKIYQKYTSIDVLKKKLRENPYKCLCGLAGVGFKTADAILLDIEHISNQNISNGQEPIIVFESDLATSEQRCLACIMYLLEENEKDGHTKKNLIELRNECIKLTPACANHFTNALKDKSIFYNKEKLEVSLKNTYLIEYNIAKVILKNINSEQNVWDFDVEKYRNINDVELSDEQLQVIRNVCKYNISILNGAGGTGKTFSTQSVINMLKDNKKSFQLFSPTGKAAKVLTSYTKVQAKTIHRGLGYVPPSEWTFNEDNKLSCDMLIIDEFSMVDIHLFKRVIDALDFSKTKLLLIGDNAQLPSVACGNLLHDFMETNIIPTITLSKVFRYGEGGLMTVATDVRYCKKYLNDNMKKKMTVFGDNKDYVFVDLDSEQIPDNVVELYKKLLMQGYKVDDIQVLTAKNVGDCGAILLNNKIQKIANPSFSGDVFMKVGDTTYYERDIIMQKQNNYKAVLVDEYNCEMTNYLTDKPETVFIANGETGTILNVEKTYVIIDFDGVRVKYKRDDMLTVGLGYATTIHKSQGSSIKIVILCTPQSHIFMLNSNLLYVGLTRMKEKCFHLGTLNSVNLATTKKANLIRHTFMQDLLLNMPQEEYEKEEENKNEEKFNGE